MLSWTLVTKSSEDLESNSHFAVCSYPSTNSSWKNSKELYLSSINRSVTSPVTSTNTTSDLHSSPTPMNKSGTPDLQNTTNQYIYHNSGLLNSLTNEFIEQKKNDIIKLNTMKQEFEVNSPNSQIQSNPATLTSLTCSTVTTPAEAEVETKTTALSTQGLDNSSHEHNQTSWSSCNPEFLKSEYTSQEDSNTSYPLYLNYTIPIGKNTEASCLPVDKVQNSSVKGDVSDNTTTTTNSSNDNISNEKYTTQDMSKSTLNPLNPLHSSHLLNEQQQQHEEQLSVTKQNEQISLNMLNSGHLNYYDEHHSLAQSPPNNSNNNNNNFDRLPYCNGYNLPSVLPPPCHNPLQHEMKFPPFIMSNYTEQINRNNYYFPDEMQSHESDLTQMNNAKLNYCASSLDTTNTKVSSSTNNSSIVNHEVFEKYNNESYLNAYSAYAENYPQILNYPAESNNHASSTNYTSTYLTNLDKVNNSLSSMNDSRDVFSGGPTQNPLQLSMNQYDSDHSNVHHLSHHHHTHQHDHHSLLQHHPHPHPHHHNQQHSEVTDFNPECTNMFINTLNYRPSSNMNEEYCASLSPSSELCMHNSDPSIPYKYSSINSAHLTSYDPMTFLHEINLASVNSNQLDRISHSERGQNINSSNNNNTNSNNNNSNSNNNNNSRMSAFMAAAAVAAAVSHNNNNNNNNDNSNTNLTNSTNIKRANANIDGQFNRQTNTYNLLGQSNNFLMAAAAASLSNYELFTILIQHALLIDKLRLAFLRYS
ncbi:unnamed protein product [Trichobilharzia regenti]|nr:unnamed protein product [Trichobilharzia regenti]